MIMWGIKTFECCFSSRGRGVRDEENERNKKRTARGDEELKNDHHKETRSVLNNDETT